MYTQYGAHGGDSTGRNISNAVLDETAARVAAELTGSNIPSFELHRARIPTDLFKTIVEDTDLMQIQHGAFHEQSTREARSRFIAPIFNRLVAQFRFALGNKPQTVIKGRMATHGRIEHLYKFANTDALFFVEVRHRQRYGRERLDLIAQIMAECDGCDLNNAFNEPIHCMLLHGQDCEFFKCQINSASTPHSFSRGEFSKDFTGHLGNIISPNSGDSLRTLCEIIFDLLLAAYICGAKAFLKHSGEDTGPWRNVLASAESALEICRTADSQRENGDVESADASVTQAMIALQESVNSIPDAYLPKSKPLMSAWDDDVIGGT